jgi:cell division protease FtsH
MSERLGPRTFGKREELIFLGREISEQRNYSEKVAEEIDEEVRRIIDGAYQTARQVLSDNRLKLNQLAKHLIEEETIEGDTLEALFNAPVEAEPTPAADEPQPEADRKPEEKEARPEPLIAPPKPGLAWGGGQATARLEPDVPEQ